jgi:hypothetical protein
MPGNLIFVFKIKKGISNIPFLIHNKMIFIYLNNDNTICGAELACEKEDIVVC